MRIEQITPQAPFDRGDTADRPDRINMAAGDEVVAAGDHALNKHFRRARQHHRGLAPERMAEQHGGCQNENDDGVNEEQGDMLAFASRQ